MVSPPYPGAWIDITLADGTTVTAKIFETKPAPTTTPAEQQGKVYTHDGHLYLGAADRAVEILSLQPAGKRRMEAGEFLRGARL